jgi:transposase
LSGECARNCIKNPVKVLIRMFTLSSESKFHLYNKSTDMRKSFDGLSGLVQNELGSNPCNGEVFMFINKTRDKIKLLHWQGNSFTLYYKRLEQGTFEIPRYDKKVGSITLSYTHMAMIIDGLSIKNIPKRKRYEPTF